MKAVILAGGEGTRLRPLSCHRPKPMVGLFDRPVLEHILRYLRSYGITDICATLQTMPYSITDYFGDGRAFGVRLSYEVESVPLGTAGSVAACSHFLSPGEDFLVVSGDAVLDLDLGPCLELHRRRSAMATLVLHRQSRLLEYGLVMTDGEQRVTRFIEKPSWSQVFCDTVNTGVYILNASALDRVPAGQPLDFARDLFPQFLREGTPIYAEAAEGYWCDIGDPDAYRQCCFDALDRKISLEMPAPAVSDFVWAHGPWPDDVAVIAPCYIGPDVHLGRGVTVGPYAVVGEGCFLGDRAVVERSVLEGAQLGPDTRVSGAVVCRGGVLRAGAALCEGAVLGENVVVGEYAVVREDARIWPGKEIEPGARFSGSLTAGQRRRPAVFDGRGLISGQPNVDVTPDFCLKLGAACAALADGGPVGLAHNGDAAHILALAFQAGVCAAGGDVAAHDAPTPACAAFAAAQESWPVSLFIFQEAGRTDLFFFESDGLPLRHAYERRLDGDVARGEIRLARAENMGSVRPAEGFPARYVAAATADGAAGSLQLGAPGDFPAASLLRAALSALGVRIRAGGGLPTLSVSRDGLLLSATDERGRELPHERLLSMAAMLEWEDGREVLAAPYNAPVSLDALARTMGKTLMRLGRDGEEARRHFSATPSLRDGLFMACRLCRELMRSGQTLAALSDRLPPFSVSVAEVGLRGDRGAVMRHLARAFQSETAELFDGLRAPMGGGWVHIAPLPGRRALRIIGEAASEEMAAELCAQVRNRTRMLDKKE